MPDTTVTPEHSGEASANVKIEDVGPALKRLTITISPETVSEKIDESIGTLSHETILPGFRRGKAPRQLLERRFGSTVRNETKNRLIADAYARAVEEHGIQPVGEPEPTVPTETLELVVVQGPACRPRAVAVAPHHQRARGPRAVLQQRLIPGAGLVVLIDGIGGGLERAQAIPVVERMEGLEMEYGRTSVDGIDREIAD